MTWHAFGDRVAAKLVLIPANPAPCKVVEAGVGDAGPSIGSIFTVRGDTTPDIPGGPFDESRVMRGG